MAEANPPDTVISIVETKKPPDNIDGRIKKRNTESASNTTSVFQRYQKQIKGYLEGIRYLMITVVVILLLLGFIHNIFSSDEKDIKQETFQKLIDVMMSSVNGDIFKREGKGKWQPPADQQRSQVSTQNY